MGGAEQRGGAETASHLVPPFPRTSFRVSLTPPPPTPGRGMLADYRRVPTGDGGTAPGGGRSRGRGVASVRLPLCKHKKKICSAWMFQILDVQRSPSSRLPSS